MYNLTFCVSIVKIKADQLQTTVEGGVIIASYASTYELPYEKYIFLSLVTLISYPAVILPMKRKHRNKNWNFFKIKEGFI
jgi:hypothetical protein